MNPSHRPHCNGHDYYERGIYLITIVVANRDHLLGELNMDIANPAVNLTPLGEAVMEEWEKIPMNQKCHNHKVKTLAASVMPDHFHGVLFVEERMDVSVGQVIRGFKVGCTKRWRALMAADEQSSQPKMAEDGNENGTQLCPPSQPGVQTGSCPPSQPGAPTGSCPPSQPGAPTGSCPPSQPFLAATPPPSPTPPPPDLRRMSRAQRARYYASLPRAQRPLFDDNYDDSFLWRKGQLQAMIAYVNDNPRRAILKARVPQFMQSCLCLTIAGVRYSAFGNFLLLRSPLKAQVFCHRLARMEQLTLEERLANGYTALPYEPGTRTKVRYIDTQAWLHDRDAWINDAQEGTVLVTPGISPGELAMKNIAIENRLPLIHLQKEPITKKPEGERFFACAEGSLLILAPWPEDLDAMPRPPQSSAPPQSPASPGRDRREQQRGQNTCLGGGPNPGQTSLPPLRGIRGGPSDYDRFHNMNLLAKQICEMDTINLPLSFRVIG